MSANMLKLMLAVSGLLLGILMLEWLVIGSDEAPSAIVAESNESKSFDVDLPEIKSSGKTQEMYADMVERPLFIDGRRPVEESEETSASVEESKIEDLTLMGVYIRDELSTAMFDVQDDKKQYVKKQLGDEISGWLIQEIHADRVVLERDGAMETLLLRKPKLSKAKAGVKAPKQKRENPFKQATK